MLPEGFAELNLAPHWLLEGRGGSFCDYVTPQGQLCDAGLAPKTISHPEYRAAANYAYHLDAGKFAPFLARHCRERLGVRHVRADVIAVNQGAAGDIESVVTAQAGTLAGDLFVDCSGFGLLREKERQGAELRRRLPTHRELLAKIHHYGLQAA